MMKIKHKSLANKYPKSRVIYDVLSGGNKYRKPKFCEHNMVGYKDLSNVVDRQLIIINRLAKAVVSMEKKFSDNSGGNRNLLYSGQEISPDNKFNSTIAFI